MINAQSFDRLFEEFFREGVSADRFTRRRFYNAINIWQNDRELTLTARAPGMKTEDIEISLDGNNLTLKDNSDGGNGFSRAFTLPCEIDAAGASASLENGILTLHLPVAPKEAPKRIAVRTV